MCVANPASAAIGLGTFAIGAAQGVAGYEQQSQAAQRQNQFYALNEQSTNQALVNSYASDGLQLSQERAKDSQDLFEQEKKSVAAQGTAIAAAGGAGVGGLSVDQLTQDYAARYSNYATDVNRNFAGDAAYMQGLETSQDDSAISRINSVPKAVAPSWIDAGLRIAGAGFQGAGTYYDDQNLRTDWQQGPVSFNAPQP